MQEWQRELNEASFTPTESPKEEWGFQVHLISSEDLVHWLQTGSRGQIDLDGVEVERYGFINEPYRAFYGTLAGDQSWELVETIWNPPFYEKHKKYAW